MKCKLHTFAAALSLAAAVMVATAIAQAPRGWGPEGQGSGTPPTATPSPTPTPTPRNQFDCQAVAGKVWDFFTGRCKECLYSVVMTRDTQPIDIQHYLLTGQRIPIGSSTHGHVDTTFNQDDVVVESPANGIGRQNLPVFNFLDNFFNQQIAAAYSPMFGGSSETVVYNSMNFFSQYIQLYQMNTSGLHWFNDVRELWIEGPPGVLTRRPTPWGVFLNQASSAQTVFLDANGNFIPASAVVDPNVLRVPGSTLAPAINPNSNYKLCYRYTVRGVGSPVALLLPGCNYADLEPTVAEFPLHPKHKFSAWHGSSCMPLLAVNVKDGNITSPTQLIGEWTGATEQELNKETSKYVHGFAALKEFDLNKDGKVNGAELAPFSLWSDADKDGKSDTGEVTSISQFGVTELRYGNFKPEPNGNLIVENGYDAVLKGEKVSARLIDWYGAIGNSQEEIRTVIPRNIVFGEAADRLREQQPDCTRAGTIEGGWRWWLADDKSKTTMGYLTLSAQKDSTFRGTSFSILGVSKKGSPVKAMLSMWPMSAEQLSPTTARLSLDSSHGAVLSDVGLEHGGNRLSGKTIATDGNGGSFKYKWNAERVGCKVAEVTSKKNKSHG